jgi:CBS domain-containing protein
MTDLGTTPTAADVMTQQLRTVSAETSIPDVIDFLLKHKISNAPVVDSKNGRTELVGFISERDCLACLANESFYGDASQTETARTIMRAHPVCVTPETEVFALASILISHGFRHLPVVSDGVLVGIVSRRDVLRVLNEYYKAFAADQANARFFRPDFHEIVNLRFLMEGR